MEQTLKLHGTKDCDACGGTGVLLALKDGVETPTDLHERRKIYLDPINLEERACPYCQQEAV